MSDPDSSEGLYRKFIVTRADGSEKHRDCEFFVIDLDHDRFASRILRAYAQICQHEYPRLAEDLHAKAKQIEERT